ncbi:C-type mannose receptor 2-like isoform X1 [Ictalurus furcatus]|uniref:C-type mannose receptor 2-like isoform X1 n=3 Tax=Ictalurus furcatus TaxID=66913 RepID=UPI00234FB878|nr:C-type mannose receptor 2-like isoform X1 [Ictalurus furcatus]
MISYPEFSSKPHSHTPEREMKSAYFVLFLASLLEAGTCLFGKMYTFVNMNVSWVDAQTYCRSNYVDLISFESNYDLLDFVTIMEISRNGQSWIGLSKSPNALAFTQWSDGSPVQFTSWQNGRSSANNQLKTSNINQCVAILRSGNWSTYSCKEHLSFYCYSWYPQIILVQELKPWEEALRHCRTIYTDLISLPTETDFFVVNRSLRNQETMVWTGLRFIDSSWFWVNHEPLGSLVNQPSCPAPSFRCGALVPGTMVLENRDCMEKMNFICYKEDV